MAQRRRLKDDLAAGHVAGVRHSDGTRAPATITAAFLECHGYLRKFLSGFLRVPQDVEDVTQEAFLRAYLAEQRASIDQPTPFLFRVAKNLALTRLSRKSKLITDYIEEAGASVVIETVAGTDEELEAQECLGLYCEAIASLPEKSRQIFLLRKVHGLSHKEIAERLTLSISSVEKHLRHGILACEVYLRDREGSTAVHQLRARRSQQEGG